MMSTQSDDDDNVTVHFTKPIITVKAYVSRGPSGWPETFKRSDADKELAAFVAPIPIDDLVEVYIAQRELSEQKVVDWYTVIGFLARNMHCTPKAVPHTVAIAFWGRVIIAGQLGRAN